MKHYPQKVPKHKCKESKGDLVIRALLLTKTDLEHIMEVCFCYEHHQCTSTCINLLLSAILINLLFPLMYSYLSGCRRLTRNRIKLVKLQHGGW